MTKTCRHKSQKTDKAKVLDELTGPVWGCWYQWKDIQKRYKLVNMLEILHTHVCKWKNETC
jgi:hypothetical protein